MRIRWVLMVAAVALPGLAAASSMVPIPLDAQWRDERGTPRAVDAPVLALAAGALDGDGVADLIVAYATGDGHGRIAVYEGRGLAGDRMPIGLVGPSPFPGAARIHEVSFVPELLAVADVNGDGLQDVAAAERGTTELFVLLRSHPERFGALRQITLPAKIDTLAALDIDRPDGRPELLVATWDPERGSFLHVYEASSKSAIEDPGPARLISTRTVALPERARTIRPVWLRDNPYTSIEIRGDSGSWVVRGRPRRSTAGDDRVLPLGESGKEPRNPQLARPVRFVERLPETVRLALSRPQGSEPVAALALRLNRDAHDDYVVAFSSDEAPTAVVSADEVVLEVTTTVDINLPGDGECSLREAILKANAMTIGGECGFPATDVIHFGIGGGSDTATMQLDSPLPDLLGDTSIDGTTQGCAQGPCIVLDGTGLGPAAGLTLRGSNQTIIGLSIQNFDGPGIRIQSSTNVVDGNFIGADLTGSLARPNAEGVLVESGFGNQLGGALGNVISGNLGDGVRIVAGQSQMDGNTVGLNAAASTALANGGDGVLVVGPAYDVEIGASTIPSNIISGNLGAGVRITGAAVLPEVNHNFIGTDPSGLASIPNGGDGVVVTDCSEALIHGNTISGNAGFGVRVEGPTSDGNDIEANMIGTDRNGLVGPGLGNALGGVLVEDATATWIGPFIPNFPEFVANVIAGNGGPGVAVTNAVGTADGNRISENSIFGNSELGIDLGFDGVTPNDAGDIDSGPNGLQNSPQLTFLEIRTFDVNVVGEFDGVADASYLLEFFSGDSGDPSGYGEGRRFIGSAEVYADSAGLVSFDLLIPITDGQPRGDYVTATARCYDVLCTTFGTSEFSNWLFFDYAGGDEDSDGISNGSDCKPADAALWAASSSAITDLRLEQTSGQTRLFWSAPVETGGIPGTQFFDTISSSDPDDFTYPTVFAVELNGFDTEAHDPRPIAPGGLEYYLVRADNRCGPAPAGTDSSGAGRLVQFLVSNLNDDGPGSLRAAVAVASPGETIVVDPVGTLFLDSHLALNDKELTVIGSGVDWLTITSSDDDSKRGFWVTDAGDLTVKEMTISYCGANGFGDPGDPRITVESCVLGSQTTVAPAFSESGATLTIRDSTVLADSTGVRVELAGFAIVESSTVVLSQDGGPFGRGAVASQSTGTVVSVRSSTLIGSGFPAAMGQGSAKLEISNSILVSDVADCQGSVQSLGYNLADECSFTQPGDIVGISDPLLGPLTDNGGSTPTYLPQPGSPAIDSGDCPEFVTDQRGLPRPVDDPAVPNVSTGCDIGAVERQPAL